MTNPNVDLRKRVVYIYGKVILITDEVKVW